MPARGLAAGLRAALALHRLAERVEGHQVAAAPKAMVTML